MVAPAQGLADRWSPHAHARGRGGPCRQTRRDAGFCRGEGPRDRGRAGPRDRRTPSFARGCGGGNAVLRPRQAGR